MSVSARDKSLSRRWTSIGPTRCQPRIIADKLHNFRFDTIFKLYSRIMNCNELLKVRSFCDVNKIFNNISSEVLTASCPQIPGKLMIAKGDPPASKESIYEEVVNKLMASKHDLSPARAHQRFHSLDIGLQKI